MADDPAQSYPLPSGDETLATKITASIWVMASISTIFIALRIYCRSTRAGKLWWDDFLLITSWVFLITSVGLQTEMYRLGYLVTELSTPELSPRNLASDTTMKLALAFSKSSFALTVAKLASGWTWTRWTVVVVAVIMNSAMIIHGILVWRRNCGLYGDNETWTFNPCWSPYSGIWMNMIGSSMFSFLSISAIIHTNKKNSHFCCHRLYSRSPAHLHHPQAADEQDGKDWYCHLHVHWYLVSFFIFFFINEKPADDF